MHTTRTGLSFSETIDRFLLCDRRAVFSRTVRGVSREEKNMWASGRRIRIRIVTKALLDSAALTLLSVDCTHLFSPIFPWLLRHAVARRWAACQGPSTGISFFCSRPPVVKIYFHACAVYGLVAEKSHVALRRERTFWGRRARRHMSSVEVRYNFSSSARPRYVLEPCIRVVVPSINEIYLVFFSR